MPRPILLGVVGDSASGKTTLTRGLLRILGEAQVTHISADHYHRYDRGQRAQRGLTPLNPQSNNMDRSPRPMMLVCRWPAHKQLPRW